MAKPRKKTKKDATGRTRVDAFRERMREQELVRHELWVPRDMTREEKKILQAWIPEILADIRAPSQLGEQSP